MNKVLLISFISFYLLGVSSAFSQDEAEIRKQFNTAEAYEIVDDFIGAMDIFTQLVKQDPDNANFNFRLANAIMKSKSHRDPLPYLEKAIKGVDPKKYKAHYKNRFAPDLAWFQIAKEYHRTMQFEKALSAYKTCLTYINSRNTPLIEEVEGYIKNCQSGIALQKRPVKVKHIDFAPASMLEKYVHSPLFSPDESVFIFTASDKSNEEITTEDIESDYDDNIYWMKRVNGRWTKPSILSPNIYSSRKEASIGISPDGNTLLIYRNDYGDGNIYYSDYDQNGQWSKPKKFPSPINTSAQESNASLSADGNILYFTSDRKGGYGGMDLYMSKKGSDGKWSAPVNLGDKINTKWHEESPHLQAYSNILYFCSNRPESMGGFDIFRCELENDKEISNLVNLGFPINTPYNDIFFKTTVDGKKGYFSSNCKSSYGERDLSIVEFLDMKLFPNVTVQGIVIDQEGDTLKNSLVSLFDIGAKDITDSAYTNKKSGAFTFDLSSENRYFASFHHEGWVYFSKPFHIEKYFANNTFSNIIHLDPILLSDSSMRQSLGDFKIMRRDLGKRKRGEISEDDFVESDILFDQISSQDEIAFSKGNASMNPLARRIEDVGLVADIKGPQSVLPELDRVIDLDMPVGNIVIPINLPEDEYERLKSQADSLLKIGISQFESKEYISAVESLEQALNNYEDLGLEKEMIVSANYLAKALTESGRVDEAIPPHLLALSLLRNTDDKKAISDKEYEIGIAYDMIYNKGKSVSYLAKSKNKRAGLNDLDGQIQSLNALINVYEKHSDYENMILALEELLALTREKGDKAEIASVLNRLGLAYNLLNKHEKAMEYFNESIAEAEGIGDKKALSIYLNNIGNSYFSQEEYDIALDFYQRSLDLKQEIGFVEGESLTLHNMGNTHNRLGHFDKAIKLLTSSLAIANKINNERLVTQNHFSLMQSNKALEKFASALTHYKEYIKRRIPGYSDLDFQQTQRGDKYALNQGHIDKLMKKLEKQGLVFKKERKKRERELALLETQKERRKVANIAIGSSSIGVFLILLLFGRRLRTKQKLNKQLTATNRMILQQKDHIINQKTELQAINTQLEKLSIVASETDNAVSILDEKGNFEWVNQGFVDLYGKTSKELNTQETMSIFNIHNDQVSIDLINESLDKQESVNFEALKQTANGAHIWMNSSVTPIFNEGELLKIIVIDSDVNEIKEKEREIGLQRDEIARQRDKIEEQRDIALQQKDEIEKQAITLQDTIDELQSTQKKLIEAEKMASLGNLVAGIAHEINTPVGIGIAAASSFKTKTETLNKQFQEKKMKQSDLVTYLASAKDATNLLKVNLNRTGELVKSFKQVSVDEITEQCRPFIFKEYLQDVLNSLEPKLSEKTVELHINCSDEIKLNSYPGAFAQILTNFVVNSIMHGFLNRDGGTITINGNQENDMFTFEFIDDGVGMTEESVRKCFDPFYTTNMQLGTGLGLNIVYNLVNQKLNGEVTCKSTLGDGACFTVSVPLNVQTEA